MPRVAMGPLLVVALRATRRPALSVSRNIERQQMAKRLKMVTRQRPLLQKHDSIEAQKATLSE